MTSESSSSGRGCVFNSPLLFVLLSSLRLPSVKALTVLNFHRTTKCSGRSLALAMFFQFSQEHHQRSELHFRNPGSPKFQVSAAGRHAPVHTGYLCCALQGFPPVAAKTQLSGGRPPGRVLMVRWGGSIKVAQWLDDGKSMKVPSKWMIWGNPIFLKTHMGHILHQLPRSAGSLVPAENYDTFPSWQCPQAAE